MSDPIYETWRCLGEASAWGAYVALADAEDTWGPVRDGVVGFNRQDEVTGTQALREMLDAASLT